MNVKSPTVGFRLAGVILVGGGKIRPLPQPVFACQKKRTSSRREAPKSILLVAWSHPRYPHRFESHPVGKFEAVLGWQSQFINALQYGPRSHLVVRLPGLDRGLFQAQQLAERCGSSRFDDRKQPFRETLVGYGLVVVDYPSTTCLELFIANVPSVFFWNPKGWPMREEARPYFDKLRGAGILWDSPREAAAKVAEVYEQPLKWWAQPEIQKVRREFADRYALAECDWKAHWVKALTEEVALAKVCRLESNET